MVAARLGCKSCAHGGCQLGLAIKAVHMVAARLGCKCCAHGGWQAWLSAVHMVAARLGCKSGTGCVNSRPGCINQHRKLYLHLVGGLFLAGKAAWTLGG